MNIRKVGVYFSGLAVVFIACSLLAFLPRLWNPGSPDIWNPSVLSDYVEQLRSYLYGIGTGESFLYYSGVKERDFSEDIGSYFSLSFLYGAGAGLAALLLAVVLGPWLVYKRKGWVAETMQFLGFIPDFLLIMLLQTGAVFLYHATGSQAIKVAALADGDPPVLLPMISFGLIPAVHLVRNLYERTSMELEREYILTARSKGVPTPWIYILHIYRNVLPYLKADLSKTAALITGNLFIIEYLYNLPGITRLILFHGGPKAKEPFAFPLLFNSFLTLLLLYALLYLCLRILTALLEWGVAHD
ncbi:ABC transporter permease subunit [Melghirimyces profundicolus]|uniref:ABC transporter permease subunit n=1 Tax=Melghirimyces profundicolus TaxID=1242148 RepID=UPI001475E289|nr:ABC transporter permease subunit [Melghirimyces profundicolus]